VIQAIAYANIAFRKCQASTARNAPYAKPIYLCQIRQGIMLWRESLAKGNSTAPGDVKKLYPGRICSFT